MSELKLVAKVVNIEGRPFLQAADGRLYGAITRPAGTMITVYGGGDRRAGVTERKEAISLNFGTAYFHEDPRLCKLEEPHPRNTVFEPGDKIRRVTSGRWIGVTAAQMAEIGEVIKYRGALGQEAIAASVNFPSTGIGTYWSDCLEIVEKGPIKPEAPKVTGGTVSQHVTINAPSSDDCQHEHPVFGWRCVLKGDHRERCVTGGGIPFGAGTPREGEVRHSAFGIHFDLPDAEMGRSKRHLAAKAAELAFITGAVMEADINGASAADKKRNRAPLPSSVLLQLDTQKLCKGYRKVRR